MFRKQQIYVLITIIFLIIVVFSVLIFSGPEETQTPTTDIPIFSPTTSSRPFQTSNLQPIMTDEVPLIPESQGGGVDLNASIVQNSRTEISKLLPLLPYQTTINNVSILIPGAEYQETPWVLDVQVFNVDYQVEETDPNYQIQKDLFLSAVSNIFNWMNQSGINPERIIISWGDRAYIRDRAEKWLSE